jgi:8-oxo-dGTP pyrophosphatase MutT (NUDIX family)
MNIDENINPWTTLQSTSVYDNSWINVTEFNIINPNNGIGIYGKVHFKNIAIGILVLDNKNNTWLIGQYRFPINKYSWEIPEGGGDLNTDPLESAKRELKEETGIVAKNWSLLLEMDLSNSVSDERALIFVAKDLKFEEAEPEETEQLQIKKLPFNDVFNMVINGEIRDSMTVASVLKAKILIENEEL